MSIIEIETVKSMSETFSSMGFNRSESKSDFTNWLSEQVNVTNDQINTADQALQDLAVGKTDNLHHVMLSLEKAKLSLELVVQVRNKLLEGYQELLRMQI